MVWQFIVRTAVALAMLPMPVVAMGRPLGQASRSSDTESARAFQEARRLAQDGEWPRARRQYEEIVERYGDDQGDLAAKALLELALSSWRRADTAGALATAEELERRFGNTPSAAGALVLRGDILMSTATTVDDVSHARQHYAEVRSRFVRGLYPDLEWRIRAAIGVGRTSLVLREIDDAAGAFLSVIDARTSEAYRAVARLGWADVLIRRRDWSAATRTLQDIVSSPSSACCALDGDDSVAGRAQRRLTLIHRVIMRPRRGRSPWSRARPLDLATPLKDPIAVASTSAGRLLIADEGVPLSGIVEAGETILTRLEPDRDLRAVWWGRGGEAQVMSERSVWSGRSRRPREFPMTWDGRTSTLDDLTAGARGLFGRWFLIDRDENRVITFDADGRFSTRWPRTGGRLTDLAMDNRGRLYVLDRDHKWVLRADPVMATRTEVVVRADWWDRADALDVDALDHVYVLDRDEKTLSVFDDAGAVVAQIGPELPGGLVLRDPRDVAVDGGGRLFIADRGLGEIIVVD